MKKLVAVLTLLLTAVLAGCGSTDTAVRTLGAADFLEATTEDGVVLIDVRTPQEYAAGHVDGAVNLDVEDAAFADRVTELDPDTTYAVYCQSGRRSGIAAQAMADAGIASIANLDGGIGDLAAAGAPVVAP